MRGTSAKVLRALAGLMILGIYGGVATPQPSAHFVGSEACKGCHAQFYDDWKQTRMANVVRDPKVHPEAVLGDFVHPDTIRTFTLDDVAFVY